MAKFQKPKPVFRRKVIGLGVWRIPETGPITPRLKPEEPKEPAQAIGFRAKLTSDDE